jgi:2-polyprenyl-3-methyl-5-hydroxy-6-metoxy-1,4-benzoquinol methylase
MRKPDHDAAHAGGFPLDYEARGYAYVERENATLLALLERHLLNTTSRPRLLDVGCGAGANARGVKARRPDAEIVGVEPNPAAARLATAACDRVVLGTLSDFSGRSGAPFDAVVLSDVIEHVVEPVRFLKELLARPDCARARLFVSVPNYAVWYNRLRTLSGRFSYTWSGLYDRTHLRFFTRESLRALFEHVGLRVVDQGVTPSFVQSAAPLLRRFFEADVARGDHLSLGESKAYQAYARFVEPLETRLCEAWPTLLGFQLVSVCERR